MGFLLLVYMYAVFKGLDKKQDVEAEHPLTSSFYYLGLYVVTPFLGGLAGILGCLGLFDSLSQMFSTAAFSTVIATIAFWIFVDPLTTALEPVVIPASRKQKAARLARLKQQKIQNQIKRKKLLDEALAIEQRNLEKWHNLLSQQADFLASVFAGRHNDIEKRKHEIIESGVRAWQIGGIECMKELRRMTLDAVEKKYNANIKIDYLTFWWDGIGSWRMHSFTGLGT